MSLIEAVPSPLSPRQLDCLALAREGKNSSEIGRSLGISPRTVDQHIEAARAKLRVRTRLQAVVEAQAQGWLDRKTVELSR